jgi:hypothetical protein
MIGSKVSWKQWFKSQLIEKFWICVASGVMTTLIFAGPYAWAAAGAAVVCLCIWAGIDELMQRRAARREVWMVVYRFPKDEAGDAR